MLFFKCLLESCTQLETNWCCLGKVLWVRLRFVSYDATNMSQSSRRRHLELLGCRVGKCQQVVAEHGQWVVEIGTGCSAGRVVNVLRCWQWTEEPFGLFSRWMCADSFCAHAAVGTPAGGARGLEEAARVWSFCLLPRAHEGKAHAPLLRQHRRDAVTSFLQPACSQVLYKRLILPAPGSCSLKLLLPGKALPFPNFKRT